MTKLFFADRATLMSPRTAKYIEAMIREGDNFDYNKWLKKVRQEEAQAKRVRTAIPGRDVVATPVVYPINTSGSRDARASFGSALNSKPALNRRALRRRYQEAKSKTPNARLRRWLERVHCAWGEFQANRKRDAIYNFL